jgi:uncharacterized protein (DUF2267 family)
MGLGAWMVDWLELVMASHGGSTHAEAKVVEAFLYVMSRRATHESLARSEGLLGALKATVLHLQAIFSNDPSARPASIDLTSAEAMVSVLEGMTTGAWPDRVLSLGEVGDEISDARELSAIA